MTQDRPDPEALLAAVQKQEASAQRGRLKIYFGMAAGVGKTFAMLSDAQQARTEGADVVVGVVETHGRAETEALLAGLEVVPRRLVEHRGVTLREMDLETIRARKPAIVLVDELAHTNAPGSRHAKRHQDIVELLEAGIDVWTTVNVQHFESRADAVAQITGVRVHETVPDTLLELADEIELIDLSPDELRKRLAEGKVYTPDRSEVAAGNFFRVGNLTALREMALRLTAEHVDHQLQDYMQIKRIAGPWKSGERLMVAVGPAPHAERLIRWTRRMAYNLEAPWLAVHVEIARALPAEQQDAVARHLTLARSLGAEVVTTSGDDVVEGLLRVARQRNVSQLVAGKPVHPWWQTLLGGGSLVDRLLRQAGAIDIYVVSHESADGQPDARFHVERAFHSSWRDYGLALAVVLGVALLNVLAQPWITYLGVGLTELLAVLLVAVYIGRGPALLAATLSAISWNFLFIEPRFTIAINQPQDIILFLLYFAIAIFTGNLTARVRLQERQAHANAERTAALYALAHETATAVNMDDVVKTALEQIGVVFGAQAAVFLAHGDRLQREAHPASTLQVDEREFGAALWVFENGRAAGHFTQTLPLAAAQYLPLRTANRTVGVLGVRLPGERPPTFDQRLLLETFAGQIALGIERELLDEAATQATLLQESDRLYTTLLNSISHELRTPIAAISGAASSLRDSRTLADAPARTALIQDIHDATDRLNRLVENLLDMSRLESGHLALKRDWCDVGDVIATAVRSTGACLEHHPLTLDVAPGLPLLRIDFVLVEQVLVNLLVNVCHYTPAGAPARIAAHAVALGRDRWVQVEVIDSGPGIPPEERARVFDKFHRLQGTVAGGTGLGLATSRGIAEAHGGTLTVDTAPDGGARFILRLPATGTAPQAHEAAGHSAAAEVAA